MRPRPEVEGSVAGLARELGVRVMLVGQPQVVVKSGNWRGTTAAG